MDVLNEGECPISGAPSISNSSGGQCYPQHFLHYSHSLKTIEKIVLDCKTDNKTVIFAGEDKLGLYIQIGLIGFDTYKAREAQTQHKIVYGRRWRIEPFLPTSELVQTLFLAVKKAREHEVREMLKLRVEEKYSAPFSSHQDSFLIVSMAEALTSNGRVANFTQFRKALVDVTNNMLFDHALLRVVNVERRLNKQIIVDMMMKPTAHSELPETQPGPLTLILSEMSVNHFLFSLMDAFIAKSDRYVANTFQYKNVKRFSEELSIKAIAKLSIATRRLHEKGDETFKCNLTAHNLNIDQRRAPEVNSMTMSQKVKSQLEGFQPLTGIYPTLMQK